ncbi:putative protein tramtrack, beta isoform-like isoform X2 [Penaeus vannamei]|uniref:BTB domain-containing protein n=1 Tax=Penaeus vannamei TaxID=6689 RepID=A0A3R7STC7_PENVA|nr:putative protein tramtrack, beta isoform-like isoform X2 [Penaeus vannamei]
MRQRHVLELIGSTTSPRVFQPRFPLMRTFPYNTLISPHSHVHQPLRIDISSIFVLKPESPLPIHPTVGPTLLHLTICSSFYPPNQRSIRESKSQPFYPVTESNGVRAMHLSPPHPPHPPPSYPPLSPPSAHSPCLPRELKHDKVSSGVRMAMSPQQFCLRWNNHQSNIISVFEQLLQSESFVDVTLAVEGMTLKAHKVVLSACSPYFQAVLASHPDKHPIVILKDVRYTDMRDLLDFMYRGEVSVDQDNLSGFLRVAESLRIKGLTEVNEKKRLENSSSAYLMPQAMPGAAPPGVAPGVVPMAPLTPLPGDPPPLKRPPLSPSATYGAKRRRGRPPKISEPDDLSKEADTKVGREAIGERMSLLPCTPHHVAIALHSPFPLLPFHSLPSSSLVSLVSFILFSLFLNFSFLPVRRVSSTLSFTHSHSLISFFPSLSSRFTLFFLASKASFHSHFLTFLLLRFLQFLSLSLSLLALFLLSLSFSFPTSSIPSSSPPPPSPTLPPYLEPDHKHIFTHRTKQVHA